MRPNSLLLILLLPTVIAGCDAGESTTRKAPALDGSVDGVMDDLQAMDDPAFDADPLGDPAGEIEGPELPVTELGADSDVPIDLPAEVDSGWTKFTFAESSHLTDPPHVRSRELVRQTRRVSWQDGDDSGSCEMPEESFEAADSILGSAGFVQGMLDGFECGDGIIFDLLVTFTIELPEASLTQDATLCVHVATAESDPRRLVNMMSAACLSP